MTYTMTKTERIARQKLFRHLWEAERDSLDAGIRAEAPDAWHTLEADLDVTEPKVKVTLYLDQSVARFFRAMGPGYQPRINRILATWAHMKIGGLIAFERKLAERHGIVLGRERAAQQAGIRTPGFGSDVQGP